MDFYFDCYSQLSLQRFMVSDKPRTDAFAAAIKEVVNGGERVLDIGTGSGLLAILASKAGAEKVYALDQAEIAKAAQLTIERNGLTGPVELIHGNATGLQLMEPVDLIISEWLGHFAFAETMIDDVLVCRNENLKEGGKMLPSGVELMLAPVDSAALYDDEGPGFWKNEVHGIDFSHFEDLELKQSVAVKTLILPEDLIGAAQAMVTLDMATCAVDAHWQHGDLEFTIDRDGSLNGFAGWFIAQLSPSVVLDTGPEHPTTHWKQTYFPFPATPVKKGQVVKVHFALDKHPIETRSLELKLTVDGHQLIYTVG